MLKKSCTFAASTHKSTIMASDKKTDKTVRLYSEKGKLSNQNKGTLEKREALRQQLTDMELAMAALKEKLQEDLFQIRIDKGEISPTEEKAPDKSSLSGYGVSDIIAVMFDLERKRQKEQQADERMKEFDAKIEKYEKQVLALQEEFENKKKPGKSSKKR